MTLTFDRLTFQLSKSEEQLRNMSAAALPTCTVESLSLLYLFLYLYLYIIEDDACKVRGLSFKPKIWDTKEGLDQSASE